MKNSILTILFIVLPALVAAQHTITIDGDFSDWADVPVAVTDSVDDVHDTDGYPEGGQPAYVEYSDVDLLEVKFTNDAENLYGYMRASGVIGRTSSDTLGHSKKGRYYFIFTIDVDMNDTTGYRLEEGGYYPDSKGYDMNMEVEFYNGGYNTGHYLNHEYTSEADYNANWQQDLDNRVVRLGPGTYDWYSQWVMFPNDSVVVVEDKGPVHHGIIEIAVSADGHEAEMVAPMWGFLNTPEGEPIIDTGQSIIVSASLEGSGELSEAAANLGYTPGSKSVWGSDTADPFTYEVIDPSTSILDGTPESNLPLTAVLHQNYPNPFNPSTTISYEINQESAVSIIIYSILGEEVVTLIDENHSPGRYELNWNALGSSGSVLPSGIYIVRLSTAVGSQTRRVVLIR